MLKERTIKIIKFLMNANNGVSFEMLANEFQISVRTLRNEISTANYFLVKQHVGYIKNVKKFGLIFEVNKQQEDKLLFSIEQMSQHVFLQPEERYFDLILDIAFNSNPTYLYNKEVQYQVSKSTLDEDMRKVRLLLHDYQIEIISIAKQGLIFIGSEHSIRTMLFDLINNHIGMLDYKVHPIDESAYDKILFTYVSKETFQQIDLIYDETISSKQDNYYRTYCLIFTGIWINRIKKNPLSLLPTNLNITQEQSGITDFINKIRDKLKITISIKEIKYLLFILQTLNSKNIDNSLEWIQSQLLTVELIQFVERNTNIPFSKLDDGLYEGLYCHMVGLLSRMKHNLQVINPLKESIKKNHHLLYRSIENFSPIIEKAVKKQITSDEITFLTIYFSTSESKINQNTIYIYKAAIICNHGSATAKLLAENLKERFNIEIIAILSSRELDILERLDVDIIFSTIKIENISKPSFVLQPIIRDLDKEKIESFLEQNNHLQRKINVTSDHTKLFLSILSIVEKNFGKVNKEVYQDLVHTLEENNLQINKEEVQPMLNEILKDNSILFDLPVSNWEEAIQKVSQPLIESHVIKTSYVDAMITAVKNHGPYIVIDKHIALAHARPEDGVNKLGISVAKLKQPINFGNQDNDPVKIIFCLAAIDSYSHLNIMKNLVELINDKNKINCLFTAKNKHDFQKILNS